MKGRRDLKGLRRDFSVGVAKPLDAGEGSPLARVRILSRSIIRGAGVLVSEPRPVPELVEEEEEILVIGLSGAGDDEEARGVSGSISISSGSTAGGGAAEAEDHE